MTTIFQATIFGEEDAISIGLPPQTPSARIRRLFRPAPLFAAIDGREGRRPVGVPVDVWERFQADAKRHAKDHPKAAPLKFASWVPSQAPSRRGRPSTRPVGHPDDVCEGYRRMRLRKLSKDPAANIPSIEDWIRESERWRETGRAGGIAAKAALRQVVQWVVVVPRRELTRHPDIERSWAKRINNEPDIGRQYRISLRGVQRRAS